MTSFLKKYIAHTDACIYLLLGCSFRGSFSPAASKARGHGPKNALIRDFVTSSKSSFFGVLPSSACFCRRASIAHCFLSASVTPYTPNKKSTLFTVRSKEYNRSINRDTKRKLCAYQRVRPGKADAAAINRLHSSHQIALNLKIRQVS